MRLFTHTFQVNAPIEPVADFHSSPQALKRLMPFPIFVKFHRIDPLAEQSIADFTIWFGPFPIHWTAIHANVDTLQGFTDIQVNGPMKHWQHTHSFSKAGENNTLVQDHIEFEHRQGIKFIWTQILYAPVMLRILFLYRLWVTRREVSRIMKNNSKK